MVLVALCDQLSVYRRVFFVFSVSHPFAQFARTKELIGLAIYSLLYELAYRKDH